jgi:hypothetical protein
MNKLLVVAASVAAHGACKTGADPAIRADISAKLQSAQNPIQQCYQRQLTSNRKLRGMVVVQMAAHPETGQFIDISTRRDEPHDPVLRYCIVQALAKLKLDKPPGRRVEITSVPIRFEWANP